MSINTHVYLDIKGMFLIFKCKVKSYIFQMLNINFNSFPSINVY